MTLALVLLSCDVSDNKPANLQEGTVVLLHGLLRSSKSMTRMEKALQKAGYQTCNIDYPSGEYPVEVLAIEFVLPAYHECLNDASNANIHFVTHSMGGIILRYLDAEGALDGAGRVVMLGPPNQGSELVDELGHLALFKWLNGPAGNQLGTGNSSFVNQLPELNRETGIIAGDVSLNPFYSFLIPGKDDGKVSLEKSQLETMSDHLVVPHSHTFLMNKDVVITQTLYFLTHGYFCRTH